MKILIVVLISMGIALNVLAASNKDRVDLYVTDGCAACLVSEKRLHEANIAFNEKPLKSNMSFAPTLYVNNQFYGIGVEAVNKYINERR